MIDNYFRKFLQPRVSLIIGFYQKLGLTPNILTVIGVLLGGLAAGLCALNIAGVVVVAVWWMSRFLDGTDGILARATGQTSEFGAYLDITGDMLAYGLMVIGFMVRFPQLQLVWAWILLLYVLCITTALALGSGLEQKQIKNTDNRGLRLANGLAEGAETGLAYTVFLLLPEFIEVSAMIWVCILVITVVARTLLAFRILR